MVTIAQDVSKRDALGREFRRLHKIEASLTEEEIDDRDYRGVRSTSDVLHDLRRLKGEHRDRCPSRPCYCFPPTSAFII